MKRKVIDTPPPPRAADGRGVSQILFVLIGMGIISGGLWTLYMGDAPYHPENEVSQNGIFLAGD